MRRAVAANDDDCARAAAAIPAVCHAAVTESVIRHNILPESQRQLGHDFNGIDADIQHMGDIPMKNRKAGAGWGYYPSGGLGLIVIILLILVLLGRI